MSSSTSSRPKRITLQFGWNTSIRYKSPISSPSAADGRSLVSQEDFADMCGLDRTYIGEIERSERNLSLINIETIVQTFKIPQAQLFRGV
jgi:hypothetical protein